jgi:hypothetical protein
MLIVLFLFQSMGVIRRKYNNYDSNSFKESTATELTADDEFQVQTNSEKVLLSGKKYVVYIGDIDDDYGRTVYQWCRFTKRNVISYKDIDDYTMSNWNKPEMVLLDSNYVDYYTQMDAVIAISDADVNVTLCNLPDYDTTRKNDRLMEYCSIESSARRIVASGLRVFDDFLIGGEIWLNEDNNTDGTYNDLEITIPWYVTTTGTKTYMAAELSAEDYPDVKNENQPSLVWRKRWNDAYVFCINGEFIKDISGMGILSAIAYDAKDYDIYPAVDAQTYIVENFPYLSSENDNQIQKYYSRTTESFSKNVIWPDLTNLSTKLSVKFTYMVAPQYNYADKIFTSISELDYFFRLIREQDTEAGLTNSRGTRDNMTEKLEADRNTYRNYLGNYEFLSILLTGQEISDIGDVKNDILNDVKTYVVSSEEYDGSGLFYYTDDDILTILTPVNGEKYTFGKDFTVRCLNTVLAYCNIDVNLRDTFYPEDEDNLWNKYIKDVSGAAENLTLASTNFSKCTVSELDQHVREMLSLDYSYRLDGNDLVVDIKGNQETSRFVLRTHKTGIQSVSGGTYTEIEEGTYIITTTEKQIRITF